MFEIFKTIQDLNHVKQRTQGKFDFLAVAEIMHEVREYEKPMRPIDVVRCIITMLLTYDDDETADLSEEEAAAGIQDNSTATRAGAMAEDDNDDMEFLFKVIDIVDTAYKCPVT